MSVNPLVLLAVLLVLTLLIVSCEGGYQIGSPLNKPVYDQGFEAGRKKGYEMGYKEGFEKGRPGTAIALSGISAEIYTILVWGGVLKIILSLFIANIAIIFSTGNGLEITGKSLFAILGAGATVVLAVFLKFTADTEAILLAPAPQFFLWQLLLVAGASVATYWLFDGLVRFLSANHSQVIQGWLVFVLSAILALLVPIGWGLFKSVPEITKYVSAYIFCGVLIGGIYFVATALLKGRFERLT